MAYDYPEYSDDYGIPPEFGGYEDLPKGGGYSPQAATPVNVRRVPQNSMPPMPMTSTPSQITYADPAAVAAAEQVKARIQAQFLMADARPRNYLNSRSRIMQACQRPAFAAKVEYSKPVGNSSISGPSIRFAELALREWGNIDYQNTVVYDDDHCRRINIVITDLETNTTFSSSVVVIKEIERKSSKGREVISERKNSYGETVYLVKATDDEVMTRQQALISKALRNEGLRLIPQEIIEEAIVTARNTLKANIKQNPEAARNKMADAFTALGIMPSELEKYLGHPLSQCNADEIANLQAVYTAVKSGDAKWADYISDDEEAKERALSKAEELKEKLRRRKEAAQKQTQTKASAEKPKPQASAAQPSNGASDPHAEVRRMLRDNLGELGLGLTDAEAEEWSKRNFGKGLAELSEDEIYAADQIARAEIAALDKRNA